MDLDLTAKLAKCRNYTEAKPILEMVGIGPAGHEIMQLYFAQPDNSPYRTRFLESIVQEAENGPANEKDKSGPHDKGKNIGDEKPTQEEEGGTSQQSTTTEGLNKIGTEKSPVGDAGAEPTESQMKEMPMGIPGMPPEIQQQMMGAAEKMPPMNPMQQMKMMQYTIKEIMKPHLAKVDRALSGLNALDQKIREMETKSHPLTIPGGNEAVMPKGWGPMQEISGGGGPNDWQHGIQSPPPKRDVNAIRQEIVEKDALITITKQGKDPNQMYS